MRSARLRVGLIAALTLIRAGGADAQNAQPTNPATSWFSVPANAIYETGDTWIVGDARYQLYGVQSCLRGTEFTNGKGVKRDCGEASLAMLASLVRDLRPLCYRAAFRAETKTGFVFCFATIADGPAKGSRIDLGTALITLGWAFAALGPDGHPIHPPYYAAQQLAEKAKAGLWAFADIPDPNVLILRAYARAHASSASTATITPSGETAPK